MLRGLRWPLFALIGAAILFIAGIVLRGGESPPVVPPPQTTPAPVETPLPTTAPIEAIAQTDMTPVPLVDSDVATYREGLIGTVQRLNPLLSDLNPVDRDITALIFEGLTRIDQYGQPIPALAERWIISSDGLEYIVFLRQDVLWQDGIPFSPADVIYTMSLLRSPDFPGGEALGAFWRTVETETLDDHTIRFRLTQPLGNFLDKLRIGLLPEHALRGTTAAGIANHPFNLTPIGTGAYQLETMRFDGAAIREIDLRVAPVYRQRAEGQAQRYAIDRVRFVLHDSFDAALAALNAGAIDGLAARDRAERPALFGAANARGFVVQNALEPTFGVLIYNWANDSTAYFREQRVRVALETGLDRTAIIDRALGNLAVRADSPIVPGSWAYQADLPRAGYDPSGALNQLRIAAERLSVRAAQAAPADAPTSDPLAATPIPEALFTFTILTPDDPGLIRVAQEIATQWAQLDVSVNVESVDAAAYQTRLEAGEFDAAIVEFSLGESADPDQYPFWHQGQYQTPGGRNYGSMDDRRISEILERARRDPYGVNRANAYDDFQRLFVERAVALPLYYPLYTFVTAANIDGVQLGFIGSPADRFRTIGDWSRR